MNRSFSPRHPLSWQSCIILSSACFLLAFLLSMNYLQKEREAMASRLAPFVLRLHILADSDDNADQQVKMEIRSLILDYLKNHLSSSADKAETISCLKKHQKEIETMADRYLQQKGFDYHARLQLTNDYFPTRIYGKYLFPCGRYDAARITLGTGRGHNWWCVLYPQFCLVDATCQVLPETSKAETPNAPAQNTQPPETETQTPNTQIRETETPDTQAAKAQTPKTQNSGAPTPVISSGAETLPSAGQDDAFLLENHRPAIEIHFLLFPFL